MRSASAAADLAVGIVVYHPDLDVLTATLGSLRRAVERARAAAELGSVRLTVVDNSTEDQPGLVQTVAAAFDRSGGVTTDLRRGHGNVGYGRGHNLAMGDPVPTYHLVLNPDVVIDETALLEAIRFLRAHPDVGILTPEVRGGDGELQYLCRRYPSVLVLLLRGFAPRPVRQMFRAPLAHYELRDQLGSDVVRDVPLASGCFMLIRGDALRAVGGFAPEFFLYFEDYDLSLRIRRIADIAYVPQVRIVHHGGGAATKGARHVKLFVGSAYRFFRKHGWKLV